MPKTGGNTMQGSIFFSGTGESLQADNYTQAIKDAGLAKGDLDQRKQAVEQLISPLKEQLGRVATQALRRVPGSADPVPVRLARPHSRHESMPDVGVVILQRDLRFRAVLVEQAQGDARGDAGGDREVRAGLAEALTGRGAQRERAAWQR